MYKERFYNIDGIMNELNDDADVLIHNNSYNKLGEVIDIGEDYIQVSFNSGGTITIYDDEIIDFDQIDYYVAIEIA